MTVALHRKPVTVSTDIVLNAHLHLAKCKPATKETQRQRSGSNLVNQCSYEAATRIHKHRNTRLLTLARAHTNCVDKKGSSHDRFPADCTCRDLRF